jgi:hypothetical protein
MRGIATVAFFLLVVILFSGCGEEQETPSRDHVLVLNNRLGQLQEAILGRDPEAISSMLADNLRSKENVVDSLLRFVYGPDYSYPLERFGNYDILYVEDKARIDCFIMDSSAGADRPVVFTFTLEDDTLWLLKRFEVFDQPAIADSSAGDEGVD